MCLLIPARKAFVNLHSPHLRRFKRVGQAITPAATKRELLVHLIIMVRLEMSIQPSSYSAKPACIEHPLILLSVLERCRVCCTRLRPRHKGKFVTEVSILEARQKCSGDYSKKPENGNSLK